MVLIQLRKLANGVGGGSEVAGKHRHETGTEELRERQLMRNS